jgi:hypothetical protein
MATSSRPLGLRFDPPDLLLGDPEKHRELGDPLVKQWLAVDQHQRTSATLGD